MTETPVKINKINEYGYSANSYYFSTDEGIYIIDPSTPPRSLSSRQEIREMLENKSITLLATHGHFDHCSAAGLWMYQYPETQFYMAGEGQPMYEDARANASALFGVPQKLHPANQTFGDRLRITESLTIHMLKTPGHSPGSVCLLLVREENNLFTPLALFTGDLLFVNTVGRTDLWESSPQALTKSLRDLHGYAATYKFPDSLPVYCGHGPDTTWGDLLNQNIWLQSVL